MWHVTKCKSESLQHDRKKVVSVYKICKFHECHGGGSAVDSLFGRIFNWENVPPVMAPTIKWLKEATWTAASLTFMAEIQHPV